MPGYLKELQRRNVVLDTARQARLLASNETEREVLAQLEAAGFSLGR